MKNIFMKFSELDHPAKPRWPLDKDTPFLKGADSCSTSKVLLPN